MLQSYADPSRVSQIARAVVLSLFHGAVTTTAEHVRPAARR